MPSDWARGRDMNGKTEINGLKMEIFDVIFRKPVRIENERAVTVGKIWGNYENLRQLWCDRGRWWKPNIELRRPLKKCSSEKMLLYVLINELWRFDKICWSRPCSSSVRVTAWESAPPMFSILRTKRCWARQNITLLLSPRHHACSIISFYGRTPFAFQMVRQHG